MRILILFFISFSLFAKAPLNVNLKNPPPRIIRTCCSFGVDVKVAGMPFVKITEVTSFEQMGKHKFLGSKEEHNGIIYTQNGGFIDMGHLRDIADFTAYLYVLIQSQQNQGEFVLKLGNEAGMKNLILNIPENFPNEDAVHLAGKIAYDLSVWHEISTAYGASFIPLVPERYSSFSIEDAYSNLTGVILGMKALLSENAYEDEMSKNITETLIKLEAVKGEEATKDAMNAVKDIWWSGKAKLPSRKVLIKRQFAVYGCVYPMLIDDNKIENSDNNKVCVPENTLANEPLNKYYSLSIKANFKIPVKKVFGENVKEKNTITQLDFPALIKYAEEETFKEQGK
ncbi:DUF4056 domain-containing protein [Lacihabitans sp. LS3-19]|uniref:DUF4056 domain-containing protein n=1 Tax=Lacihabitans sp. LS3-19 TaxID=2487335 RepID=UPI0020CD1FFB|nr:DUF4056 domain-containing protein [Lacihabitans sp. LS3-19]MCP9768997.1 DUF4056 domain-containing protein [Lacihabitans sp. LS3-19]